MNQDTIDKSKLMTVANYARMMGCTPAYIYNRMKEGNTIKGELPKMVVIDGVKFISR